MANKEKKPWSFGLFGGKNGTKSILAFAVLVVLAITTHIAGAVYNEVRDRRARPVLALKSVLRDVRGFINTEKRMPASFKDIEFNIWNKKNADMPTRLHGENILVADNYEYRMFSGKVKGINLINVWAIPLGKYREEAETVLLVVTDGGEDVWRGPALSEDQRNRVFADESFPMTFPQLSQLNMKRDAAASTTATPGGSANQPAKPNIFK